MIASVRAFLQFPNSWPLKMEDYLSKLKRKSLQVTTMEHMVAKTRGPVQLKPVIGLFQLITLGVGAIIGAGVFVLTGEVAREHTG